MSVGLISIGICIGVEQPEEAPVQLIAAGLTGLSNGTGVDGTTLTGTLTGLTGGETVIHAWEAQNDLGQGYEGIDGEAGADIALIIGAGDIFDGTLLRYAPFVDGVQYFSQTATVVRTAPVFSVQPSIAGSLSIGNTLVLDEGVAAQSVLSITRFDLDGVDKMGELSGMTWDTAGESAGMISYQVMATNSGGVTLSDVVTGQLVNTVIGTVVPPTLSPLYETQTVSGTPGWAGFGQISNYTTTGAAITAVVQRILVNGVEVPNTTVLSEMDTLTLLTDVYTGGGLPERTFISNTITADYFCRLSVLANNRFEIDVNPLVDDAVVLPDFDLNGTIYAGVTVGATRGSPFLLDAEPGLIYVDLSDGDTVSVNSGNWLSSTGTLGLAADILIDGAPVGSPYTIVTSLDGGKNIQAKVDADDGNDTTIKIGSISIIP